MIKLNKKAPNFELKDQKGNIHTLNDYKGKFLIIYFYPKDNTPGCIKESCKFKELHQEFLSQNAVVLGISKDNAKSHQNFIKKFSLPFTLLIDEELNTIKTYNAWQEKSMYGKTYMGLQRSTVLLSPEGIVLYHWEKVKNAEKHPEEVLKKLKEVI